MAEQKYVTQQTIDKQKYSVFLRDLSKDLNLNLKHMVEDIIIDKEIQKKKEKKNHHKGKKVIKKKDLIIQEQNEKKRKNNIQEDYKRAEYLIDNLDYNDPFKLLHSIKTNEGIINYKFLLLNKYWKKKKKNMKYIILLYNDLKDEETKDNKKLIDEIKSVLDETEYKLFMMKKMGDMLPPLNNWNKEIKDFDKWQKDTINFINKKESVIVKAPTSSGKSFIAMVAGILHKKILYVCPAKPVAYQVGSHFIHMGYKVHFLLDNISNFSYSSDTNIFIGTPREIENNFNKIGFEFDYTVFDEIHNLNRKEDGDIYENIIKSMKCNFLALSATIKNIDFLKDVFSKVYPNHKINYIEYNKRFINHQRWLWKNNKLIKLHPLALYNDINDDYRDSILSYTPNDCAVIWDKVYDTFEEIDEENDMLDGCSPDEYFEDNCILTLDNCKEYELFIKSKMIEWSKNYTEKIQSIFDSFTVSKSNDRSISNDNDIIKFIQNVKKNDMFPMIMFHKDENVCRCLFNDIFEYLNKKELEEYPYHYDILEKKNELYQKYLDSREKYQSNIKVGSKTNDAQYEIREKMHLFEKKEKNTYITSIINYYESKLNDISKLDNESLKKIQTSNIKKEMNEFIEYPDFCTQDIFKKHPDFIFTNSNEPMSADTIREVRREIKKTLGIKIPYESPLFQMLKRGIGLYIENAPDEYNWILQKLLSKKEIGIVISGEILCLGIDLPVRTSCFLGIDNNTFTNEDYLQMSGRAGRRGKDTRGNIIFYGDIDYVNLIRSQQPEVIGNTNPIYNYYNVLSKYRGDNRIFNNMVNKDRCHIQFDIIEGTKENEKVIWYLREFCNTNKFVSGLYDMEVSLYNLPDNDKSIYLIHKIKEFLNDREDTILECYKFKKLEDYNKIKLIKKYLYILMGLCNTLRKDKYMFLIKTSNTVFDELNRIIFNLII